MVQIRRRRFDRLAILRENRAILVLAVLFCVFLGLTVIARSTRLLEWDRGITLWIQTHRAGWLDMLALGISFLGNGLPLVLFGFLGAAVWLVLKRPYGAFFTALSLVGLPLNMGIKALVGRPRPIDVQVLAPTHGLSFPSGHSMATAMVFGFLAFLAWVHIRRPRRRMLATAILALLPPLIGLTRIYLGAHWFSDVIGGWTIGTFFLLLFAELYKAVAQAEVTRG